MYSLHTCTLVGVRWMSNYKCTFQSVIFFKKKFLQKITNFILNPLFEKDITLSNSHFKIVNKSLKVSFAHITQLEFPNRDLANISFIKWHPESYNFKLTWPLWMPWRQFIVTADLFFYQVGPELCIFHWPT